MKLTYRQRIFCYFFIVFAIFAVSIIIIEQKEEQKQRIEVLEEKLNLYSDVIHGFLGESLISDTNKNILPKTVNLIPKDIRLTIINLDGVPVYDNSALDIKKLDNHLDRPEIRNALYQNTGFNIRTSSSTNETYFYYAKKYSNYFVRVAVPYTERTRNLLKADNLFVYIVISLFFAVLFLVNYVAGRFSKSISQLNQVSTIIKDDDELPTNLDFPNDEVGEIGKQLIDILRQKEQSKRDIEVEREKLIRHFQLSEEGICIFSPNKKKIYANTHFYQFISLILDQPTFDTDLIFVNEPFRPVVDFIQKPKRNQNNFAYSINRNNKIYLTKVIVFDDNSFEITIKDTTRLEKTRLLKQEMTSNIAHELRTPVTSLRGYLETLNEHQLSPEKQNQFIQRAYSQIVRLSDIIDDISLISRIEEAGSKFEFTKIYIHQLIDEVRIDMTDKIIENNITLDISVNDLTSVNGNYTLLYSIFHNLIDNSIKYAGKGCSIFINNYMEDNDYLYFSYYDTGKGVEEEYLNRLFERFYRVSEGRTRDTGGSGLGLSIVKNSILFHKGEIQAKNRTGAGLEFIFTLKK